MRGSAGVMALVLGQTVAGASALLWFTPLWSELKRGFFKLIGSILLALAFAWWRSAAAGLVRGDLDGTWSLRLAAASMILIFLWTALLFLRPQLIARPVVVSGVTLTVSAF